MKTTYPPRHWLQTVFQVTGFERLQFVSDVAAALPQSDDCRLERLNFESDGVRINGCLQILTPDAGQLASINRRLKAIRGVVSVEEKRCKA